MDRTHETLLLDVLRDVYVHGSARVAWYQWYRWLNAERMTKNKWRDVEKRWAALLDDLGDDDGYELGFVDSDRGDFLTLVLIDPKGELIKPISAKFEG